MKKILVPTDFSQEATHAVNLGVEMARKFDAELHLLYIAEVPVASFNAMGDSSFNPMDNIYTVQLIGSVKKKMKQLTQKEEFEGLKISTHIEVGSPYQGISSHLKKHEFDIIIMGSQGSSGTEELLIGSNTEKIIRNAKCPVITVKEPTELKAFDKIAFATSLREEEHQVVKELKALQEAFGSKIHLVTVNTPQNFTDNRSLRQRMEEFARKHEIPNVELNIYNDYDEEDGIVSFAEEINADSIAMGTHGRTGIAHLFRGSLAEDMANHAKRPLWTCRIK